MAKQVRFAGKSALLREPIQSLSQKQGRPFTVIEFFRLPFCFSRNLGLVNGRPVTLVAGGKVSGEYDDLNIGALSVLTDRTPSSPGQVLSVARVTKQFGPSRAGLIFTNGDPTGLSRNSVAGGDFQYRTLIFGNKTFQTDGYYQRTRTKVGAWGKQLRTWSEAKGGAAVLARLQSRMSQVCARQHDSAATCQEWAKA